MNSPALSANVLRFPPLLGAAGAERFMLDRLCLGDDAPLRCEVERVRETLGRVAAAAEATA